MPLALMILLTYPIMAGQFAVAKLGLAAGLTLWDIVTLRYGAAGLVMLPFLLRPDLRATLRRRIGPVLIIAAMCGGLYGVILSFAVTLAPSIHGAVLMPSTAVLSTIPLSGLLLGLWPDRRRVIAAAIIVAGLCTFGLGAGFGLAGDTAGGDVLFLLMGFTWALLGVLVKRWRLPALAVTFAIAVGGLVVVPGLLWFAPSGIGVAPWPHALLQAVYQGLLLTCLSFGLYAVIIARIGASGAVLGIAAVPLLGLLFGWALFSEMPNGLQSIGAAFVIAGLVLASGWSPVMRKRLP